MNFIWLPWKVGLINNDGIRIKPIIDSHTFHGIMGSWSFYILKSLPYKFQKKILEGNPEMKKSGFEAIDAKCNFNWLWSRHYSK